MKIIFQVSGGIGKSIAATAVCKAIKTQHPEAELIVLSGYPDVFAPNPNVSMSLTFNNLNYFYKQHVQGLDTEFFLHDPYHEKNFIYQRGHLIKVWCEMYGITYNGELPELFLTSKEKSSFGKMFESTKPILVIQSSGGVPNQTDKYSWPRDLPTAVAQKVVYAFAATHNVVHIRRKDQAELQKTFPVTADFRALAVLLAMSDKRLFIDSFAQHAAAALGLPSVVCWVANVPEQFGYEMHTNIIANARTLQPELRNAVFSQYNIGGDVTEFPYRNEDEIFDADKIIDALKKTLSP